jgi:hypothetical protein
MSLFLILFYIILTLQLAKILIMEFPVLEILEDNDINSFYGVYYGGGYVFHVNESSGELIVATDYSEIGDVAWGDVFELDTSFFSW